MNSNLPSILRKLPGMIKGADTIPLFGNAPPFDWNRLSALLAARFEMKDFSLQPSEQAWRTAEEITDGLGANYFCTPIFLNPLSSPFYFVISKADKNKLTALMMQGKAKAQISEPLKEGFCRFLVLEALGAATSIDPISKMTPSLGEKSKLPEEEAFCIDIEISFGDQSCWSRIVIPGSFRKAWVAHFAMRPSEYFSTDLARATEITLGLECGSVILSQAEWEDLKPGDFVLLDKGNYEAAPNHTLALLKAGTILLFQAKITKNQMELLDYAFTNEEPMEQNSDESPMTPTEEETTSIKNLPMQVCVELARLNISLDRLMHLNPGNMIELPIHPDQGVSLTVNGKKIGRAELLYLGESLGIRILDLG